MNQKNNKTTVCKTTNLPIEQLLSQMLETATEISSSWSLEFVCACLHKFFTNLNLGKNVQVILADDLLNGYIMVPGGQTEKLYHRDQKIFQDLSSGKREKVYDDYSVFPLSTRSGCYGFVRIQLLNDSTSLPYDLVQVLSKFMNLLAINIENYQRLSRAERSLGEKDSQLILMQEMGELIGSISDIDYLNEIIINMVKEVMNVHLCSMMLFETDKDGYEHDSFILSPEDKDRVDQEIIDSWKYIGNKVRIKQQTILLNYTDHDNQEHDSEQVSRATPFLSAPLRVNHKVVGVLHVCQKYFDEPFTTSDVDFLTTFANQVSKALENARLHQDLQSFSLMTISSLISAVETKDPFMKGHSERVTIYAKELAKAIDPPLDPHTISMIEYAATLHDIGKIGVAKEILHKKTPLQEKELLEIQKHPSLGKKILQPLKFLEEAGQLIDHHQERYDGQGYPDGQKGKEIPLGARIIAIADSFDAMTSIRPYRDRLPLETARKELKKNAGKQFDPELVEIFIRLLDSGLYMKPVNDNSEETGDLM